MREATLRLVPRLAVSRGVLLAHAVTVAALLAWWVYSLVVPSYLIPAPQLVGSKMLDYLTEPDLRVQLFISAAHVAVSMTAALVLGGALAVLAHACIPLRLLIDGRITPFLNAFSGIGWLFLGVIWFGINGVTVVFSVTLVLLPFVIINLRTGLQELDSELGELGHSLSRSRLRAFALISIPQLIPYLFATLRTCFGVAWKVMLTAELFGGNAGIGADLNEARQQLDSETIFALILFILVFVVATETLVFRPLQRRMDGRLHRG